MAESSDSAVPRYGAAKVIYGDTDSLFVCLPGRSLADAFRFGNQVAVDVTTRNRRPVKLQFEKVYTRSVFCSKKRYVGHMLESARQTTPTLDAKGIEVIRRDAPLLVAKIQREALLLLFHTRDFSAVKAYLCTVWRRILSEKVPFYNFVLSQRSKIGARLEKDKKPGTQLNDEVTLKRLDHDYSIVKDAQGRRYRQANEFAVPPHKADVRCLVVHPTAQTALNAKRGSKIRLVDKGMGLREFMNDPGRFNHACRVNQSSLIWPLLPNTRSLFFSFFVSYLARHQRSGAGARQRQRHQLERRAARRHVLH
jgi:hypothetical protein